MACKELGFERDWCIEVAPGPSNRCPVCGTALKGDFPMCSNCKSIINPKKYAELQKQGIGVTG